MSSQRKALLSTIQGAMSLAKQKGNANALANGLMATAIIARAVDTVAVAPVRFASMIGATTPLITRMAA